MKTAVTSPASPPSRLTDPGLKAWREFLVAHSRLIRELDDELRERHGVTLGDFDVLAQLANASDGHLRMCELAGAVLLSPSGLSRRVDRLERAGLVKRERAARDARNIEAQLTSAGKQLFQRLGKTHRAGIGAHFSNRFDADELETLRELLSRLTTPTT